MDYRTLPSVDRLARSVPDVPHEVAVREARVLLGQVRAGAPSPADWTEALASRIADARRPALRRVINATGIVLHTNLGRAPLSRAAADAVKTLAEGYSNLELDLETGRRGERLAGVTPLLRALTGAEDAVVVNNCAAAVLLALTAIAHGKEVVVSRGELVEIGGAFRIPDVITACGARLREVGATNRTRARDLAGGIGPDTAAILRVHPSNFKVTGFVEAPTRAETAAVARAAGVLYLEDLGSGALIEGLGEPTAREVLAEGADLVCFSGDKLLGGPQAGILAGRAEIVQKLRKHPLYRALRLDRLVLGALEATLRETHAGALPPAVVMLRTPLPELHARAEGFATAWRAAGLSVRLARDEGFSGGGALPGEGLPTWVVVLDVDDADAVARRLRSGTPAVVARIHEGALRFDPRAVLPEEEATLVARVVAAARGEG